jgi:hypothetical protein
MTVRRLVFGSRSFEESCYLHVQEYGLVNLHHKDNVTLQMVGHQSPNNAPLHLRRPEYSKCPTAGPGFKVTYLLSYSMEQSRSREANRFSASQETPCILRNPNVPYRIHNSPPHVPILSQLDPVQTSTSHFLKICLNIILPSTPESPKWSLSVRVVSKLTLCIYQTAVLIRNSHA